MKLEKVMNSNVVRSLMRYYSGKGSRRIYELFDEEKENGIKAWITGLPIRMALNYGMKKINMTEEMKESFFSKYQNKQILMNIIKTIANNGLKQPFRFDGPLIVVWNFTNVCNLHCRCCYQSAGRPLPDELTFEEKIDLINQMLDANVGYLAFSGGEPIMGPRFWDVLRYASKYLHISIASNGTLLEDKSLVDKLADYGAKNVFVSLDGATPESHDFIRGKGNFKRTIKGIENLVANPYLRVGINMVVTKRNYDEVPKVLELSRELGVNSFSHYNFIPTGRGKEDFAMDLTPEQRYKLLNLLFDWHEKRKETGLNIISTSTEYARVIYERSGGKSASFAHYSAGNSTALKGIIEYAGGCGAGRVYAAVQPNGLVSPCVFMPTVIIGNVRENKLIDIWQNSELGWQLSDRENYHFKCPKYKYICGGCRARAYAYGDILGPDPGCIVYKKLKEGLDKVELVVEKEEESNEKQAEVVFSGEENIEQEKEEVKAAI